MTRNQKENRDYVTVKELADTMGISRVAVFKQIKNGRFRALKIGRNYVIYKKDLPEIFNPTISARDKQEIEGGVKKVLREYGETIKMLGQE